MVREEDKNSKQKNLVSVVGFAVIVGIAEDFAVLAIRATLCMISRLDITHFIGAINGGTANILAFLFRLYLKTQKQKV